MITTAHVLDFLSAMIKKAERVEANEFVVIPVLVNDLGANRSIIDAAIAHAGGVILDAESAAEGVKGKVRNDLSITVSTALNIPRIGGSNLNVVLNEEADFVQATLDGSPAAAGTSPGIRTLLGIASLLFDSRIENSSLVAITYSEANLEDDVADAVWRLLTGQLSGTLLGRVRILVLLIEGSPIRYERHCTKGASVWGRLVEGGFETRKGWDADQVQINLLQRHDNRLAVFFLGAGFSATSRLPLGNDLRDSALRLLASPSSTFDSPVTIFRQFLEDERRLFPSEEFLSNTEFAQSLTLERVLLEEVFRYGKDASPTLLSFREMNARALSFRGRSVAALRKLTSRQRGFILVTVNFDTLIETGNEENVRVFASDADFEGCVDYLESYCAEGGAVPLLKLHGTIDHLDTIIATVDQISRGLADAKTAALRKVIHLNRPNKTGWIYVGYSMRDPDVTNLLSMREFGEGLDETWVSPFIIPTAQRFFERNRMHSTGPDFWQRSITETADVFFEELVETWGL